MHVHIARVLHHVPALLLTVRQIESNRIKSNVFALNSSNPMPPLPPKTAAHKLPTHDA
jgi:hypothetical protein